MKYVHDSFFPDEQARDLRFRRVDAWSRRRVAPEDQVEAIIDEEVSWRT